MKKFLYTIVPVLALVAFIACVEQSEVDKKKAQLATYKEELFELK